MNKNDIFDIPKNFEIDIKPCSQEEFQKFSYIELQKILKREFPNEPNKQYIKHEIDGLQFACPFCGDSSHDSFKKRGHFIFKQGEFFNMYKCFNCGKYMSIRSFFKYFKIGIPSKVSDYLIENKPTAEFSSGNNKNLINSLFDVENIKKISLPVKWMKDKYGFYDINNNSHNPGYYYMIGRNQYSFNHFLYDEKSSSVIIMNLLDNDHCIGFQIRPIHKSFGGSKYITISLQKIHDKILKDNVVVPAKAETLSKIFGIFEINLNFPILVTEGPLDSLLLDNSIALLGAAKEIPFDFPFYYVYDSDRTGIKHSIDHIDKKDHVFLWQKLKDDLKLPKRKKWDINDVVNYCIDNKMRIPDWNNYFSNNIFDIINI